MKPIHVLLSTGLLMGVSAANMKWEVSYLGVAAWLVSFGIIFYAARKAFSSKSNFLDKEFTEEGAVQSSSGTFVDTESGYAAKKTGLRHSAGRETIWKLIASVIFMTADNEINKIDSTGRTSYKVKYIISFVMWLPASWFSWGLILFNLLKL